MFSADNHTGNHAFSAIRGVSIRVIENTKNRAPNPRKPCTFVIWTFRVESHQITVRKPAESMRFRNAWERSQRNKRILRFVGELAGHSHAECNKTEENQLTAFSVLSTKHLIYIHI